nr:porin [Gammaproteobacteria bacterium]NIR85410.1 porin [Gammaproteobacteria bacterium]NIR89101.1 porin [Gammaproteobacteria bacterium]NIU06546.1 porin [Gammaproteobacteria bacterium]NIV53435.1 porin [Gammaproteobacteria bacterium]
MRRHTAYGTATTLNAWGAAGLMALLSGMAAEATAQTPPDPEEMWRIIQEQQRQIEALESQLRSTEQKTEQTEEKVEATARMVEERAAKAPDYGAAPGWWQRTTIGGYGEIHYNNLENDSTGEDFEQVDVHRLVLTLGHEFNDWLRLFSEVELEHALVEDTDDGSGPGEVELEQAWVEADYLPQHRVRAGVDLIPVGILNPTHEPPTFFGVERNPVETNIIPTTWWEAGVGGLGEIAPGWNYHVVLHSGLETPVAGDDAFLIREGRNKVAKATASDGAVTGQLRYTGMRGVEVGLTGQYQADVTQGEQDIEGTLFAAHVDARRGPFGLRALYARWDLDDGPAGLGP